MRPEGFLCFFLRVEDDVAGGIVDPLYSEVRVHVEIVPYELVAHVVHTEKVPAVGSDLNCLLCEVGRGSFVEKLYVERRVLSPVWTFSSG